VPAGAACGLTAASAQANFDPDPGVSAGTVFGVQRPPRRDGRTDSAARRGAVSAAPDVATVVTSPVNYPLVADTTTRERLRPLDGHDMRG